MVLAGLPWQTAVAAKLELPLDVGLGRKLALAKQAAAKRLAALEETLADRPVAVRQFYEVQVLPDTKSVPTAVRQLLVPLVSVLMLTRLLPTRLAIAAAAKLLAPAGLVQTEVSPSLLAKLSPLGLVLVRLRPGLQSVAPDDRRPPVFPDLAVIRLGPVGPRPATVPRQSVIH